MKEDNRKNQKNKNQIQTKAKEREGKNNKNSDRVLCKNIHTPFHIFFPFIFLLRT